MYIFLLIYLQFRNNYGQNAKDLAQIYNHKGIYNILCGRDELNDVNQPIQPIKSYLWNISNNNKYYAPYRKNKSPLKARTQTRRFRSS